MYDKKPTDALVYASSKDIDTLEAGHTPESVLAGEEEEQAREKAIFHGKKRLTTMERKVFNRSLKGLSEETIANQLRISQQRVNKLKQKAVEKVRKLYDEFRRTTS